MPKIKIMVLAGENGKFDNRGPAVLIIIVYLRLCKVGMLLNELPILL